MAELHPRERLQPALLDRLTDHDSGSSVESRDSRVLSMRGLRQAVLRDLTWLLNANGLHGLQHLADYPLAASSVVNFGFPDLTGRTASGLNLEQVSDLIRDAIWNFEPRILRDTLEVTLSSQGEGGANHVSFEIAGELWGQPLPERFYVKTDLDLEIGEFRMAGASAQEA